MDSREYLAQHQVQEKLAAAVTSTLKARPADPLNFIAKLLIEGAGTDEDKMLAEIGKMSGPEGFDILIVCCSNQAAEDYWQTRLEATVKQVTGAAGTVLCVHEDWNGGAGNGLGTLYAFQKACAKGAARGVDVAKAMADGAAVALYHTAGKGTRLAPLPGAENNNKPGVKLPSLLTVESKQVPITVLECVMRQTSSYAPVRKGRCSVFWGDQIFVPSVGIAPSTAPADILAALRPMPSKAEWEAEQLHQYGLIAVDPRGAATQLEKVNYETATAYLPPDVEKVGTSLGSFSVSSALMTALLEEFAPELAAKCEALDSDPHFWMPLTLKEADYVTVMAKKKTDEATSRAHYARMAAFRQKFDPSGAPVLACVDVGTKAHWWDYGRLGLYLENNALLTHDSAAAHALRTFLGITSRQQDNQLGSGLTVDASSVVLGCRLGGGRVGKGCVLVNVHAPSVDVEGCILVNVTSSVPIKGESGLLYNVLHEEGVPELAASAVRADVFGPGGEHTIMHSSAEIDGGTAWKDVVLSNKYSFEGIYKKNLELDVGECTAIAEGAHAAARAKLPPM